MKLIVLISTFKESPTGFVENTVRLDLYRAAIGQPVSCKATLSEITTYDTDNGSAHTTEVCRLPNWEKRTLECTGLHDLSNWLSSNFGDRQVLLASLQEIYNQSEDTSEERPEWPIGPNDQVRSVTHHAYLLSNPSYGGDLSV